MTLTIDHPDDVIRALGRRARAVPRHRGPEAGRARRMTHERRPVLMSIELAEILGLLDRITKVVDARTVVVPLAESEMLAMGRAERVEWGEPDDSGYFTPTVYAKPPVAIP